MWQSREWGQCGKSRCRFAADKPVPKGLLWACIVVNGLYLIICIAAIAVGAADWSIIVELIMLICLIVLDVRALQGIWTQPLRMLSIAVPCFDVVTSLVDPSVWSSGAVIAIGAILITLLILSPNIILFFKSKDLVS